MRRGSPVDGEAEGGEGVDRDDGETGLAEAEDA